MKKVKNILNSFIVFIIYILLSFYLSKWLKGLINNNNFWISNLSSIFVIFVIDLILVLIFYKTLKKDFYDFKKNYRNYITVGLKYWFYGLIIMLIVNNLLVKLLSGIPTNEEENRELLRKMPLYSALVMCFLGPISEEIIFRLNIRKCFSNITIYAIFSGILFGLMHVIVSDNLLQYLYIIPYGVLGYCFAIAYAKTDNIFTSITIHSLHNILTILMIVLTGSI